MNYKSSPPLQDILSAIDLPTLVQHSLDPPSSPTLHNALEPLAGQPDSLTPRSLAPIIKEPQTYAHAQDILDPNWQKTMDEELPTLQLNQNYRYHWAETH